MFLSQIPVTNTIKEHCNMRYRCIQEVILLLIQINSRPEQEKTEYPPAPLLNVKFLFPVPELVILLSVSDFIHLLRITVNYKNICPTVRPRRQMSRMWKLTAADWAEDKAKATAAGFITG